MIFLLLLQLTIISPLLVMGQVTPRPVVTPKDTVNIIQDSLTVSGPKGDIETTIKYSAKDSIQFEVDRKVVHLYGDAKINYGTISLSAAYIEIDYETNTLTATTLPDSTGKEIGVPVFVNGAETYAAKKIAYNYKTKKGRIADVVTQQGEGYIHAELVKKNEDNDIYGLHARYTTCNLEHPHFYINASRIKAIPNDKVMSGPFNLVIGDIPTPLGFLFGLFPTPRAKRASGVIVPSFGESRARGFYLSNGGYYFAVNDYIGTSITGDIYSLGGYRVSMDNTYIKRYSYSGNLRLDYDYFKNDEADIVGTDLRSQLPPSTRSFWINWSHSPVQKPGRGRFTASVNAGSTLHQRLAYTNTTQYLAPTFNSNISYQKNIQNTPFSYTAKLSQGQQSGALSNNRIGVMNFVLPDVNFSMTPISIYEALTKNVPTGQWYENFTIGYNVTARNEVSNVVQPRTLGGIPVIGESRADTFAINGSNLSRLWNNGRRSAQHNFSIGLGSFKLLRYLNLSPSVSYNEVWLDKKFTYRYNADSNKVEVDTTNFGRIYEYNAGASLNTTVYGTVYVKGKRVEAIRHIMRPSISYSYRPDFGDENRFGYYQRVQTDTLNGREVFTTLPRFYSNVPGAGLQSALSFSLQNNIEMKVRSKSDTASTAFEKVSIIDNLGLSAAYNFAADSFKLSTINMNMNTRLFKLFNVNLTSTFDPYQINAEGQRINKYLFQGSGFNLARLTNASLSVGASLNPEARRTSAGGSATNLPSLQQNQNSLMPDYVDFKIPWTLNFDFTLYYQNALLRNQKDQITKNLSVDGSLNMTDKWKITYMAAYDFTNNNIAHANLQIYRDLHCWEMSIGWSPVGFQRGYNVTINARSALLRDLRLTKNRTGFNR